VKVVKDNTKSGKVLSKLKQDSLNRKQKKLKKQVSRMVAQNNISVPPPPLAPVPVDDFDDLGMSVTLWDEGKALLMVVDCLLEEYSSMLTAGTNTLKLGLTTTEETDTLTADVVNLSNDILTFKRKWYSIAEQFSGKSGEVDICDIQEYYTLHGQIVSLQDEITNVLADSAYTVTAKINNLLVKEKR